MMKTNGYVWHVFAMLVLCSGYSPSSALVTNSRSSLSRGRQQSQLQVNNLAGVDIKIPDIPNIQTIDPVNAASSSLGLPTEVILDYAPWVVAFFSFFFVIGQREAGITEGKAEVIDQIIKGEINVETVSSKAQIFLGKCT